ncbi:hypothetical protein N624_1660 [Levilactobacillus brevis]|nr:hypothetical protein N624_1660 [Levilactobacillus brevis]
MDERTGNVRFFILAINKNLSSVIDENLLPTTDIVEPHFVFLLY